MVARKAKLTNEVIKNLSAGEIAWDTEIAGFGVRCQKKAVVFFLQKRFRGALKWYTIGKLGEPWTVKSARVKAQAWLGDIAKGIDPAKERELSDALPTVRGMMDRYIDDHAMEHKKASSVRADKANIENHIIPILGKKFVADVSDADIDRFKKAVKAGKTAKARKDKKSIQGGPVIANRCLALLSKAFNMSIRWKWRNDNPVALVAKYKEIKKERFLSEKEFAALFDALNQEEKDVGNSFAIAALRLLTMTGARHNEILCLKWSEVDFENNRLNLSDSKTGKKSIFLSAPAQEILSKLNREKNNPFVICGSKEGTHLVNLRKTWLRVKEKATLLIWKQNGAISEYLDALDLAERKLNFKDLKMLLSKEFGDLPDGLLDVRIHDLRHSFASVAAASGMSLHMIGKLLGHSQASTTARYAHFADDPIKQANDAIGARLQGLMGQRGGHNVVKISNS